MKLFPLYEMLMESVSLGDIKDSILTHKQVQLEYDDGISGVRLVEPYVYGEMRNGNPVIRAFQISGPTKTDNNQWKIFRVDKIKSYKLTQQVFNNPRPKFNSQGDRTFGKVILIADFNKSFLKKAGNFLNKGIDKVKSLFKSHHEKTLSREQSILVEDFLQRENLSYTITNENVNFFFD